ncbi:MAG TPA: GH116 family glycosyl hydrolase [Candidatus Paceibacterota bacterium]|nr:GH116 family glycosyl hydrolase [Verrucomicrobiota bacterium]HSA09647.1 GH116 family glycosyl hydrolase [Candidatus Paceibacterota bacterium]
MRKCNCSGHCGPQGINRREFIGLVGAGAAAAMLGTPAWGAFELPADELERWRRELFAPDQPRLYLSGRHTDTRMHLGGIGTGNIELGVDGQFTNWQLFNTLRGGQVPLHFLIRAGGVIRMLQTGGGPDWPRVKQIEMRGEYPVAELRCKDPELPVEVELAAFSPLAPLDARFSAMPLAALLFRVTNPAKQKQTVSLAAVMQNPVGYDAAGPNNSASNACFGGNVNEVLREGGRGGLYMRAEAAGEASLDKPVAIYTAANLKALLEPPPDRPEGLAVEVLGDKPLPAEKLRDPAHTVIWLEEAGTDLSEGLLRGAREAVQAGATLLWSGRTMPLLAGYGAWTGGKPVAEVSPRPDIVFEDFEGGYDKWTVTGEAFGKEPPQGTLPMQNPVTGFLGKGLVNSFVGGDDMTGRMVSKPFTIERQFIRFLVGGGRHANTQMRLVVDGNVVRATSGKDNEQLLPAMWFVGEWRGQSAHIEIVDEQMGGWGHINVDRIEFSDMPATRELMQLLEELLPARFSSLRPADGEAGNGGAVEFEGLVPQPGATESKASDGTRLLMRTVGKGKVVIAAGAVLEPARAGWSQYRQSAYTLVCGLVGASYTGGGGFQHPKAPGFGTLALAALGDEVTVLSAAAHREDAWRAFAAEGSFTPLAEARSNAPTPLGRTLYGAVAVNVNVPPGKSVDVPFLLAWHYPNKYNAVHTWMGCHYATQWADARAVMREALKDYGALHGRTERFRRTFYDSTLPYWLLDCLTANAAIIRHIGVVFRIANGDTYGWEGSNGCCQPTCTHVWGYEQSLSRLFPSLEQDMRRIDFKHQQRPDGGVNNRTEVPSPPRPTGEQPFADGHASCILKAYREALNQPDDGFFREYWPHINRAVEYLIGRDAKSAGGQPEGILQDDQWNTYDEALHGVTTFISGYYLAALRAGEEWGRRVGDKAAAERFRSVFEKGRRKLVELCWNGEYFQQHLADYMKRPGEVGPGCMADQLIGQWWAHQLGLGYILPREMVVSALRAVFNYNWKSNLTGWPHAPRAFAGAKDKGLITCTWPKGGRPGHVMLYSDEVWTGIEYQVAAHMIYEGLVEEAFAIVRGARDRYDGIPRPPIERNPWNELECGGHYARAMSSWSLLLALSGWDYDGPRQALRFTPRHTPGDFKGFFVGPEGWGSLRQTREGQTQRNELSVCEGRLAVAEFALSVAGTPKRVKVECGGKTVPSAFKSEAGGVVVSLKRPVVVGAGQKLTVGIS